jgi:hypothetical protein
VGVLVFDNPNDREHVVMRSLISFDGNVITVERHEEANNRFIAEYYVYAKIASNDFLFDHWEEPLARAVLAKVGNVCCIDPRCVHREDYVSMRAVVCLNHQCEIPSKLLVCNHSGLASITNIEHIHVWSKNEPILDFSIYQFAQFLIPAAPILPPSLLPACV